MSSGLVDDQTLLKDFAPKGSWGSAGGRRILMDSTQAAVQLIAIARATATTIHSRPGGEMTPGDIQPIEQVRGMDKFSREH